MTFRAELAAVTVATSAHGLAATLESLQAQRDTRWQWCVATSDQALHRELADWAAGDPRVQMLSGSRFAAQDLLAAALAAADARWVCMLEGGDTLDPSLVAQARLVEARSWFYTDEAAVMSDGIGSIEWLKPQFCPELLRSQPYLARSAFLPLVVVRELGGLRSSFGTAQWYDLVLRMWERSGDPEHLTGPYYRRDQGEQLGAPPWIDGKPGDRCQAVAAHCERAGIDVVEVLDVVGAGERPVGQRLRRRLITTPRVSIVIPTRGGSSQIYGFPRCHVVEMVRSLWTASRYPDLEIIVVFDEDTPPEVLDELREITEGAVVLQPFTGRFHYSRKCNQGAMAASGELVCFLNDDMQVVTPDWLHELVPLLADPSVGAAGPKLLFADGTLQHAGHHFHGGNAGHVLFGEAADTTAFGGVAQLTSERAGVTGACLLVPTALFLELGGFSEQFPLNYNDVDFCLKVRATGRRILYTPHAVLEHYESQTRAARVDEVERTRLARRWRTRLFDDPVMNPLLQPDLVQRGDVLTF